MTSDLLQQREQLRRAECNTYNPEDFPGSRRWLRHDQAEKALRDFDAAHPEILVELRRQCATQAKIHVAGRGWGDYSPVVWEGDATRPDAEIIAEMRALLAAATHVDTQPTDDQLVAAIQKVRG